MQDPSLNKTNIETNRKVLDEVKIECDDMKNKSKGAIETNGNMGQQENNSEIVIPVESSDDTLLNNARKHWHFGDWESLASLNENKFLNHPDRAKLALLVATAWQQFNDGVKTRKYVKMARDWGCDKKLIARLLIAGVHNTLGRAAAANNQEKRALTHFYAALMGVEGDLRLVVHARSVREMTRLGLFQQAAVHIGKELNAIPQNHLVVQKTDVGDPRIKILQTELELLSNELSQAHQRQQLLQSASKSLGAEVRPNDKHWLDSLKQKSVSQLGQDLWVLERTGYKKKGFFVEFGATDGVLLNNSYLLEKEFEWKGICAEPNPKFFVKLKKNRTCIVSDQCIGGETGKQVEFILADAYGGILEFSGSDFHADKRAAYRATGKVVTLNTISLDDFLKQQKAPSYIDYLSIDTEGSEFEILKKFPFDKWRIQLITIEHNFSPLRAKIRSLLEQYDYHCTEHQFDDWYELKNNTAAD